MGSTLVNYNFVCKYDIIVEVTVSDKHSSLLQLNITAVMFYDTSLKGFIQV